jgi:hypothetical protein
MHHKSGKLNIVADALSRKDEPEEGVEDNVDMTLLPEDRFSPKPPKPVDLHVNQLSFQDEDEIIEEIQRRRTQRDWTVTQGLKQKPKEFKETNGIIEFKGMIYVPRDRRLRERIIFAHHDTTIAGHPGQHKTLELIKRNYWWPGMNGQAARYVRACEKCQRTKTHKGPITGPLNPNEAPHRPFQTISADLIGPFPKSGKNKFDTIFVTVD